MIQYINWTSESVARAITPGGPLHLILSSATINDPSPSTCPNVAFTEAQEQYRTALSIIDCMKLLTILHKGPLVLVYVYNASVVYDPLQSH